MASDPSLTVTESISLQVASSPLFTDIKGGSFRTVGATETFQLEGICRDQDDELNVLAQPYYRWECYDMKNRAPCYKTFPDNPFRKRRLVLPTNQKISIDAGQILKTNS